MTDKIPVAALQRGQAYDTTGPNDEPCILMTKDTWVDFGTYVQSIKNVAGKQDSRIKEQNASEKILLARLTDLQARMDNLRAIRRAEKRPEIEALLEIPNTKAN